MRAGRNWTALLIAMFLGTPLQAHHSFPATYEANRQVTVDGKVVQLMFRNPHSFIHIMAPDADGTMQRWAIEWAGASALARENISRETLRPGDRVIASGNPGRNPQDHRILARMLQRPADGWKWQGTFQ